MSFVDKDQYNNVATEYLTLADVPQTKLEDELVKLGLGDCTGFKVLDLGGGSGGHARHALEAGAASVDVVDVSEQMLQVGKDIEAKTGYDVVMVIWAFDHARTMQALEGMWQNVSYYLKPGGRFVGVRVSNPRGKGAQSGDYGARFENVEEIADGVKYDCVVLTKPPFSFEATSMETSYTGSFEIPQKFGLSDFEYVQAEDTEIVKKDPAYWKTFLEDPHFRAFTAKKM
ncbi:hypothetical protein PRZ48_003031 [Zasmidium cellare]|uniref:Methyltransferase type 11 domain-containing protein n=1 Tax=Zasmidium cellare TaxID=395010 RepID=A0ABR0EV72_ZASCE|nr:hypothetical protein PRZ48_003031 [Zasmidium cellare]